MDQDSSNIPLVSSALMTQILIKVSGVICDTDPPVILSLMTPAADTPQSIMSSDHSGPSRAHLSLYI